MSRVINTANPGKERGQLRRTCAEVLRHLMFKRTLDDETKDMAAVLVYALEGIAETVDVTVEAWEKRDYFIKADRFRLEWEWVRPTARRLRELILAKPTALVSEIMQREVISAEELGGPEAQMNYSGVVHFVANDDEDAVNICKRLLSFLPSNNTEDPPRLAWSEPLDAVPELNSIIPDDPKRPYDMHDVITRIVDQGDFLEVHAEFAKNLIVGFGRVSGRTVGIIANQPAVLAGVLDIDSSDKASRFVRFCNAFNIPLVTLIDVPGFLPGVQQEYEGIIRHGAKMLFSYSAATVPKVSVILRKAYGGAYLAMCGKDLAADRVAAWPSAEVAVMGAEGAVGVVFRKEIEQAADREAKRRELIELYRRTFSTPYVAAARGLVDDIIEPAETRRYVAMALESVATKRDTRPSKKHGLIPL